MQVTLRRLFVKRRALSRRRSGCGAVSRRRALLQRTAACMGSTTQVLGLPRGFAFAWIVQTLLANPPLTTAMLGVLDHDDIDPARVHACSCQG